MEYKLNTAEYILIDPKGEIENTHGGTIIALRSGVTKPNPEERPQARISGGESYPYKAPITKNMYAMMLKGKSDKEYDIEIADFIFEGEGGDVDLTALEDKVRDQDKKIQNLSALGVPGKPIVAGIDFRGDQPRFYGVLPQMANELGLGDGTVFSDGSGMDGVIVRKDGDIEGSMQIGEGYENLTPLNWKDSVSSLVVGVVVVVEGEKIKVTIPTGTLMNSWFPIKISENLLLGEGKTNNIKSTLKIDVKSGNVSEIDLLKATFKFKNDVDTSALGNSENLSLGSKEYKIQADNINIKNSLIYNGLSINCNNVGWTITEDMVFYISKVFSVQSDNEKPYVKSQAPSGRVVYNEPWTSKTHSFIILGVKKSTLDTNIVYAYNIAPTDIISSTSERYYLVDNNLIGDNPNINMIVSSNFYTAFYNGIEKVLQRTSVGISSNQFNIRTNHNAVVQKLELGAFFAYYDKDNKMTEEELRTELEKILSPNFLLPDSGVVENIPYAKKRADAGGNIVTAITVADKSRDLGLVEVGNEYEIIGNDFTEYRARIEDNLSITGTGIEDVSGQIRLVTGVQLPAKIRRVI